MSITHPQVRKMLLNPTLRSLSYQIFYIIQVTSWLIYEKKVLYHPVLSEVSLLDIIELVVVLISPSNLIGVVLRALFVFRVIRLISKDD